MNILFVDHVCHQRTKSFDFFRDLVATRHEIDTFYFERHYHCRLPREKIAWADVIVFLEFIPYRFACGITGKRCVYLPMYDNEWGSKWHWRRLAMLGMNVVSFCRKVGDHARRYGARNVLDVQYAFDPDAFANMSGDPRKVILWERGAIPFSVVKQMFCPEDVDKVIIVRRQEEGLAYEPISDEDLAAYHVDIKGGGFMPKDEYFAMLSEAGVYIAPRLREGIGMAFLEQLAMGKCVIAHDEPTMNEYIENGKNGILVDMRHPRRIAAQEIVAVRSGVLELAHGLHDQWRADERKILEFFDGLAAVEPLRSPWTIKSCVTYLLYWFEGALMKTGCAQARRN